MKRIHTGLLLGAAFFLIIGVEPAAATTAPPSDKALQTGSEDQSRATSSVTFALPNGWESKSDGKRTIIAPPEPDARIVIVDVGEASDGGTASEAAWRLHSSALPPQPGLSAPRAPRDGWDEILQTVYEKAPGERRLQQAIALRRGKGWTVLLIDSSEASVERRIGGISIITQSIRPIGFQRETFAGKTAHRLDAARVEALKTFVTESMKALGVPGASIAIVEKGKVLFEGGFGVRKLGSPEPVDAQTLFMIGSNSKGLSTLLLATAVDRGLTNWDQKVVDIYPSFRLGSEATTEKVLVRHLVCACTGLPRRDVDTILGIAPGTPASDTFERLATSEPTTGFGEVFQYNNLMGAASGFIAGHLFYPKLEVGAAFDKAMENFVFKPLGMNETTLDYGRAFSGNHAAAHSLNVDGVPAIAIADPDFNVSIIPFRPTGGVWSSAHDMIKYVENEIRLGALPGGGRLASSEHILKRRQPNVPIGEDHFYGMGLMIDRQYGVEFLHHGGSTAGYKSDFIVIPEAEVGAVLLTNSDSGQFMLRPFMRRLLEIMYDGKAAAWPEIRATADRLRAEASAYRKLLQIPADKTAIGTLAKSYSSPTLGNLNISRRGDDLIFEFESFRSRMASKKNADGSFSWVVLDAGAEGFELHSTQRDGKRALVIALGQHEYIYLEER